MKKLSVILLAILLTNLAIQAQNNPALGETIEDTEHGFSYTAPVGWASEKSEGQCAGVMLTNQAKTLNIVVKPHHSNSLVNYIKQESNLATQGYKAVGEVKDLANQMKYFRVSKVFNGVNVILDTIYVPLAKDGGIVVMSFTESEQLAVEALKYSVEIVKSLQYSAPQTAQQFQTEAPDISQSQNSSIGQFLNGKKLEYYKNGSESIIRLCSGGRFSRSGQTLNSSINGRVTLANSNSGRWRTQGNQLVLNYQDGSEQIFTLRMGQSDDVIYLDDRAFLIREADCN